MTHMPILAHAAFDGLQYAVPIVGVVLAGIYFWLAFAFRYQVDRTTPLRPADALAIAVARVGLGVTLGVAALIAWSAYRDVAGVRIFVGVGLYMGRAAVWAGLGLWMVRLSGRRLAAWVICGLLVNVGLDLIVFTGWAAEGRGLLVSAALIVLLTFVTILGQRHRRRFPRGTHTRCPSCEFDLTGNASGVCPACGEPIEASAAG